MVVKLGRTQVGPLLLLFHSMTSFESGRAHVKVDCVLNVLQFWLEFTRVDSR